MIRQALAEAGLAAAEVDVVEAHGTGTRLGDPIEAQAVLATYGQDRSVPLYLGSIKSNLGHTQAAAGVAGVIKMVLAMRHRVAPQTLHIDAPSGQVDWSTGAVELLTAARPWPDTGRPRRAAVSSFGISGTNAHVILEQPPTPTPEPQPATAPPPAAVPWLLSARHPDSLTAQAQRLHTVLAADDTLDLAGVGRALATGRAQLEHRAAVVGTGRDELLAGLRAIAAEGDAANVYRGVAGTGRLAFLFPGQGAQRAGMGAPLREAFPAFADAFDEVCDRFDGLGDAVRTGEGLDETRHTQPALFAVEVALFRLMESWAVRPDVLAGHSIGELAAAHVAGIWSLADACAVVAARARLMQRLPAGGAMVAVQAPEAEVAELLRPGVDLAAVNGPSAVVLSGDEEPVTAVAAELAGRGRRTTRLRVSHAFHSARVEPMLAEFEQVLRGVTYRPPRLELISTVTGATGDPAELCTPGYWLRQVRRPVRFAAAVAAMHAGAVRRFVELGPGTACAAMVRDCLADAARAPVVLTTMPGAGEPREVVAAITGLHLSGAGPDWTRYFGRPAVPGVPAVELPTYAFRHRRYWLDGAGPGAGAESLGLTATGHPLLAGAVPLPDSDGLLLTGRVSVAGQRWLADHRIGGTVLFPATGFVELALRAGEEVGCPLLDDLVQEAPLALAPDADVAVQVAVAAPDDTGRRPVTVHARAGAGEPWVRHASGHLARDSGAEPPDLAEWPPTGATAVDLTGRYDLLAEQSFEYGPVFRSLRAVWVRGVETFAEVALPDTEHANAAGFGLHPAVLDAALHATGLTEGETDRPVLPLEWAGVRLHAAGAAELRVRLALTGTDTVSVTAHDPAGRPVLSAASLLMRPVPAAAPAARARPVSDALFQVRWVTHAAGQRAAAPAIAALRHGAGLQAAGGTLYEHPTAVAGAAAPPDLVLTCAADPDATPGVLAADALALIKAWTAEPRLAGTTLVFVTRGAVAAGPNDRVTGFAQATVWGLVRTAQLEYPDQFALLDLDEPAGALRPAVDAIAGGERAVAVRGGDVLVPELARATPAAALPADPRISTGTVLVTGGTTGLGALVARHLAGAHGVTRLVLTSRRGPAAPGSAELAARLRALGTEVLVAACDVADRGAVRSLLRRIGDDLALVVHAAGVLDDATLATMDADRLHRVLGPKVDGAWHLHRLTKDLDLAAFVLFASAAGSLGAAGQGNYAAANAYLEALAQHRAALGLPATCLAWGPWAGQGMAAALDGGRRARLARTGVLELSEPDGLALLDSALGRPEPALVPMRLDLPAMRADPAGVPPIARALLGGPARRAAAVPDAAGWRRRIAQLPQAQREPAVLDLVRGTAANVLGHPAAASVQPDTGFLEQGFDSLSAVELRNRLGAATGIRLPATAVFDHPTPLALAGALLAEITDPPGGVAEQVERELVRLQTAITATAESALSAAEHARIAARLQALTAAWAAAGRADVNGGTDLDSMSADELLGLLDEELVTPE
ncbi:MAG TPA: type I polyketide synthase [Pseudonocardiaceae bacterium]|nr:type I polyketide synthase [Pseudonocardiaceae bacterium]